MTLNKLGNFAISKKPVNALFDKEKKASEHIAITHFVTPEIFSTKNGDLGAVIKIDGTPFDVKDSEELNQLQFAFGLAIKNLDADFAVYITAYRHQVVNNFEVHTTGFVEEFLNAYQEQFKNAEMFLNDIYITLIQKQRQQAKQGFKLINLLTHRSKEFYLEKTNARIKKFKTALTNLVAQLSPYSPDILGEKINDENIAEAELLSFLSILINGKERAFVYPKESIAKFIPEKRLFFGHDTIHFKGQSNVEPDCFAAILSVKKYAPVTHAGLLNALLKTPFEYITTHSFLPIEKFAALKMIERQIKRLISTNDAAQSQILDLEQAKDDLMSDRISYGFHHNTIMVFANTVTALEEKVAQVIKIYQDQQLVVVRETLNLENAFWSQVPANFKYIRRQALISSNNLSCFCSLHNYYSGYINQNHLGSALMLAETPSKTPFFLNLHEKASGRKDDLSKGHTLLIGPSNAGKTVIMT